MVNFLKELEDQLIPEWKGAFVNYRQLKKHVKKVRQSSNPKPEPDSNQDFGGPVFHPIQALVGRITGRPDSVVVDNRDIINKVTRRIAAVEDGGEEPVYETELVQRFSKEEEVVEFFKMLDGELNKVNEFYQNKEVEFLERGELLNKQLLILSDLKKVLADCRQKKSAGASAGLSSPDRNSDSSERQSESGDSSLVMSDSQSDDVIAVLEKNGINFVNSATQAKTKAWKPKMAMRIDIPATTPTRTIAAVTSVVWEDLLNNPKKAADGGEYVNRKKIQCAEKMIRGAFLELHRGLGLLKTYSSLNMVAFTKILKKFDKASNNHVSPRYLEVVKNSQFISSDKVVRLMDEVESIFPKHFTNNDSKKAMKFLKPQHNKDSHTVTFFVGLFTGSFVALFTVYAILAYLSGLFLSGNEAAYIETVYPVFSMFALLSLHLFLYGCNLLAWKATRINYHFIFEFKPKTALNYRDAFLICTCLMTVVVAAMVVHLILLCIGFAPHQVNIIPGMLLLSLMILLVCPLNILYKSTRYCFLRVIRSIALSPLYKVVMVDFFMADQLTSQIPLFRHIESAACYVIAGNFKTQNYETCQSGKLYREFAYIIAFAPYYWRAMQCARRWFDEGNVDHLANLGKYASALVAAGARLAYERERSSQLCMAIVLVTSIVATLYQLYWDFVKDWGLLNSKSRNPWLRDDLVLKNKYIYYAAIGLNFVLRVAWVETLMRFDVGMFDSHLIEFLLASLEVIRRGHWNFYRVENEHLNNVGKFKAVKIVPLPFKETESSR